MLMLFSQSLLSARSGDKVNNNKKVRGEIQSNDKVNNAKTYKTAQMGKKKRGKTKISPAT